MSNPDIQQVGTWGVGVGPNGQVIAGERLQHIDLDWDKGITYWAELVVDRDGAVTFYSGLEDCEAGATPLDVLRAMLALHDTLGTKRAAS